MSDPLQFQEGGPRKLTAGIIVGAASTFFGVILLVLWIQQRIAPKALRLPPFPFFDNLVLWDRFSPFVVAHLVAAICLLVAGVAILGRHRLALPLFALLGWGGLVFTIAAVWPGETIEFKMHTALEQAKRFGVVGSRATAWQLVPRSVYVIGGAFVVLWLALLVTGTVHLLRARDAYGR